MTTTQTGADFAADWKQWHDQREKELAEPHGWLSVSALHWLDETPHEYPGAPGTWWQDDQAAYHDTGSGEPARFELVNSGGGTFVTDGERQIEVARRTGYLIRVRDPEASVRQEFRGVPAYEPSPAWRLRGRYIAYDEPKPVTVGAVVEGLSHVYTAPGEIEFSYEGQSYRLIAFNGKSSGFNVLFTDATSGVTTYAANRSVPVAPPGDDGAVDIDFNRATNLPCAFIDLATCPLPPEGNQLPFAVEAGEKLPYERGGSA